MLYNTLTCYIIDDEYHSIENLADLILQIPNLQLAGSNTDPIAAINEMAEGLKPDILFLDINMPEISGLQVIELIDKSIIIIFITGYMGYAVDAFEKEAFDFLLKPIKFERFEQAMLKVQKSLIGPLAHKKNDVASMYINTGGKGRFVNVKYAEILFIEAIGHYLSIQTMSENYRTRLSMKDVQEHLPAQLFTRVHKSFIVSFDKIKMVTGNQVTLVNDFRIPIGSFYKDFLMNKVIMHIRKDPE